MPGDLDRQGREADDEAGDLHDEGGGAVAGLDRGEIEAAGFARRADFQKALKQTPLPTVGTPPAKAGQNGLSPKQIGAGLFVPRRLKCRGWFARLHPKVT
ncbi:hypothetical protein D3C81_1944650 [compost metagenome]